MIKRFLVAFFLCMGIAVGGLAQPDADELAKKASFISYYQGKDGKSLVTMTITDAQGRTRERQMTILRLNIEENGAQKYYVYFHKPADVKGMAYIVWKHIDKDDDRWLYLSAMDLVRRIAASDKRSSFAGTNFLYEDVSGRSVSLDAHEFEKEEGDFYILKNTPKDAAQVEFAYYKVWVDKKTFIPMKAHYYDEQDSLYRTIEVLKTQEIQGNPTIVTMKASDLNSGSSTVTQFNEVTYDIGLGDDIFTERYLRKTPVQWIKG
ncbi:MAG: outer membrane lipoprotein-sorting protein [Candidatus Omnitrophica bacterium]|nr:outer membrane lipoprotein-sorting protein [Candidatus Omnitrophota bacterium]